MQCCVQGTEAQRRGGACPSRNSAKLLRCAQNKSRVNKCTHISANIFFWNYNTLKSVLLRAKGAYRMSEKKIKYVGLRVIPEVHGKLQYIAEYEGRTINGQVLYLIQKCIREFEKENGPIQFEGEA